MKPVAIILMVLAVAALVGVGYLYMNANVTVIGIDCVAADAADAADSFNAILDEVDGKTFTGTLLSGSQGDMANNYKAEDCQFLTYTLRLRNDSFIPAEAVELQVTPMAEDILQTADLIRHDLPARSSGELSATILTSKSTHNVREVDVTWYMWGLPFSKRVIYNH